MLEAQRMNNASNKAPPIPAPRRTRPDIFRADRGNAQKEKIHHNASCEHNRDAVGADQ
jgi:hypothetical protein